MSSRNVIIFGTSDIDRSVVLQLAGVKDAAPSPRDVFETRKHTVVIAQQVYTLFDTAGLSDHDHDVDPRKALGMLHKFALVLNGPINLLVYVVRGKISGNNYQLFYEHLGQREVPIILFQQDPNSESVGPEFKFDHQLFSVHKEDVQDAIKRKCKKKVKMIAPEDLFMTTAMASWKLLENTAGWTLADCRDALKDTLIEEGSYSEGDAENACENATELIKRKYFHNIIVFGSTGVGKTSVINMLTDKCQLPVNAASAGGSTFESKSYRVELGPYNYTFHDTVGLNDATLATTSPQQALQNLFQLVKKIEGGVSLLIYVHRGKITPQNVEDYKLFNAMCENKVPIALVVTGLEEVDPDHWWPRNKPLFEKVKMQTTHVACLTATKGIYVRGLKAHVYQEQYDESKKRFKNMLRAAPLEKVWKVKASSWVSTALVDVYKMLAKKFHWRPLASNQWLVDSFVRNLEMSKDDASSLAGDVERVLTW